MNLEPILIFHFAANGSISSDSYVKKGAKKNCGTVHEARFRLVFRNVHCASLNETNKIEKEQWD
jgi:hypothetical protein